MDAPKAAEVQETKSEKTDQTQKNAKTYECGLCDTEIVYRIAQELLPGLASSCVDNTTGGIFTSAGTIAVDMRKEMADYLTQRSETYVAEFLLSENTSNLEISENPFDIIITLIDDFSSSKRNMFSRVSEWVLSDRREDRIDDFVQEMEIHGFWLLARREHIATILLKNVDYKNAFHCNETCNSEEEVNKHRSECKFRPMDCINEGCTTRYCAAQKEHHEAVCPFMILPCEQKCSDFVMRREMDRHCVTVCPMKLVNCPFYTVGCKASISRCNVQQHNADDLSAHLLFIIRTAHKDASDAHLQNRVEQIRKLSNIEKLARARDARALTYLIKDSESKLGPLEVKTKPNTGQSAESANHDDNNQNDPQSPTKTESSPLLVKDDFDSVTKTESSPNEPQPPTKTESSPLLVKDDTKNEDQPSTEKTVITEEETKLAAKETQPESPNPDSPIYSDFGSPLKGTLEEQSQREEEERTQEKTKEHSSDEEHAFYSDEEEEEITTLPSEVTKS